MIKWAQEEYYLLHSTLIKYIPGIKTDLKDNVIRVAQKITDIQEARGITDGYKYMDDILRAKINVNSVIDLYKKVVAFGRIPGVKIIRYKPKFHGVKGEELRNVTVNFIWSNAFICELQVRLGAPPVLEEENHFLYEIARCKSSLQFLDAWNNKLTQMA